MCAQKLRFHCKAPCGLKAQRCLIGVTVSGRTRKREVPNSNHGHSAILRWFFVEKRKCRLSTLVCPDRRVNLAGTHTRTTSHDTPDKGHAS
jgi:hypothetical protein